MITLFALYIKANSFFPPLPDSGKFSDPVKRFEEGDWEPQQSHRPQEQQRSFTSIVVFFLLLMQHLTLSYLDILVLN